MVRVPLYRTVASLSLMLPARTRAKITHPLTLVFLLVAFGLPASALGAGYASVSNGVTVSPSPVVIGQNFTISFTLKEVRGAPKTFENVAIAILQADNTYLFDFSMYSNVTIGAYGTWSQTATNYLLSTRPAGTYKAVIRGKYQGSWFDFDTTGSGVNPRTFTAVTQSTSGNTYKFWRDCPAAGGKKVNDDWGFFKCECTSYAANKLTQNGIPSFNNNNYPYKGIHWGYAINWINAAYSAHIPYNTTPKRGDVAWFPISPYGHVAYVESVSSSGNVTISEYNYRYPYNYGTRTLTRGTSTYPRYFIHFK